MSSTATLAIDIVSGRPDLAGFNETKAATKQLEKNMSSATASVKDTSKSVDRLASDVKGSAAAVSAAGSRVDGALDSTAGHADAVASKGAQASGALTGLGELVGGPFGEGMQKAGIAMQAAADSGDLLNVVTDSAIIRKAKDVTATATQTAASKAQAVATRATTASQWALNAALSANPLALVIIAVLALAALFVVLYKRSATFRAIVQAVGRAASAALGFVVAKARELANWIGPKISGAANAAKNVAVKAFRAYTSPIRTVLNLIKDVVGWIKRIRFPKPPGWLKSAGGFVGLGGPPDDGPRRPPGRPPGGRGGPGGGFMSYAGGRGGSGGGDVYIRVDGALDPNAVAKQIEDLLRGRGVRLGNA